jgi:hypothetical protein
MNGFIEFVLKQPKQLFYWQTICGLIYLIIISAHDWSIIVGVMIGFTTGTFIGLYIIYIIEKPKI